MASLFVIQGRDQGRRFDLATAAQTVGRDATNQIQLHDHEASRRHAELHDEGGDIEIVDLQSSNGTWVNGKKVERARLQTGDRVQIGRTQMLFTGGGDDSFSILDQV